MRVYSDGGLGFSQADPQQKKNVDYPQESPYDFRYIQMRYDVFGRQAAEYLCISCEAS